MCWSGAGGSADSLLCCWRRWRTARSESTAAAPSPPLRCSGPPPAPPGSPCLSPSLASASPLSPHRGAAFRETSCRGPPEVPTSWCRSDKEADETQWLCSLNDGDGCISAAAATGLINDRGETLNYWICCFSLFRKSCKHNILHRLRPHDSQNKCICKCKHVLFKQGCNQKLFFYNTWICKSFSYQWIIWSIELDETVRQTWWRTGF